MLPQACRDFLSLAQNHSKRWQKALTTERDQRIRLEETLEQLAKQHNHLERAFRGATVLPSSFSNPALGNKGRALYPSWTSLYLDHSETNWALQLFILSPSVFTLGSVSGKGDASDEDDDNEFFDAMEDPAEFITVPADPKYHRSFLFEISVILFILNLLCMFYFFLVLKYLFCCFFAPQEI